MNPYKLTVPKPCQQDWNKMTSAGPGKYCGSCQQVVIDFSVMTDEQIQAYFGQNQGRKTCGYFKTSQVTDSTPSLHQILFRAHQQLESSFTNRVLKRASLFVLGLLMTLAGCQTRTMGEPTIAADCHKSTAKEHLMGDTVYVASPDTIGKVNPVKGRSN